MAESEQVNQNHQKYYILVIITDGIINDMNKMLEFVDQLKELNTDEVEPLIHMSDEVNVLREDKIVETAGQQEALKNAPSKDSTYFKIPKVLDKKS